MTIRPVKFRKPRIDKVVRANGAAYFLKGPTDGFELRHERISSEGREVIVSVKQPQRNMTVNACLIHGRPKSNSVKWGLRLYDLFNFRLLRSEIRNIDVEHGFYGNVAGDLEVAHCFFHNIGAQAVQTVFRKTETSNPAWANYGGLIRIHHNIVKECGKPSGEGRAAFALSVKASGHDMAIIDNNFVENIRQPEWRPGFHSHGGITIGHQKHGVVRGNTVNYKQAWQPLIQMENCQMAEVRNNVLSGGKVEIIDCPHGVISGNVGAGEVVFKETRNGKLEVVERKPIEAEETW